ncbi:hypothetical protein, partial [Mycolicibacterium fortuitum]|uniref:hypothetical protein n=1 Tax=Mycolicibacterium fortuitum TaxID=1766 RepID=UPI000B239485
MTAFANSSVALELLKAIAPTLNYEVGQIARLPIVPLQGAKAGAIARRAVELSRQDWNEFETSWEFTTPALFRAEGGLLADRYAQVSREFAQAAELMRELESENNRVVAAAYNVTQNVPADVALSRVSLMRNVEFRYESGKSVAEYEALERADLAAELISY